MAHSNCCQAGLIEETNFHSNGVVSHSFTCKSCNKPCGIIPNPSCALFMFPNGKISEHKYPHVPRGIRSDNLKPNKVIFPNTVERQHNAEEINLWAIKCRLIVEETPPKPPLKLEVGKQYVRRDGEVTDPLQTHDDNPDSEETYTPSGESPADLISEACIDSGTIQQMQDELIPPTKANDIQHGGSHYKKAVIQPWDYIARNNIPYLEGSAIKYVSRWRDKGGIEDLKKAIHFIEKVIELEQEKNNETKTT